MANNPNDMPDASAWGQFRSQLAQAGWKQADINAAYGQQVNGRTWKDISDDGVVFLKNAPKGP